MRTYLLTASRWTSGAVTGLLFGIAMTVFARFVFPTSWTVALVYGAAAGLLFGVLMSFSLQRSRRLIRAAAGDLSTEALVAANRAAGRGPIPADPQIRAAARRIAAEQLDYTRRFRVLFIVASVFFALSLVLSVIDGFEWRNLGVVAGLAAMGLQLYWPRRLRERIRQLSAEEGTAVTDRSKDPSGS